jgi:hypothetical protein
MDILHVVVLMLENRSLTIRRRVLVMLRSEQV